MRLLTFRTSTGHHVGRVEGERVVDLGPGDVGQLLAGSDWRTRAATAGPDLTLEGLDLAPLVPRPAKIICLGLNYRGHIEELGRDTPAYPTVFAKFARSLIGAYDTIQFPTVSDELDWEAELAFVVGRPIRRASPSEAADAIAGFTVLNDISVRDWQWRTEQWLQGKTFEGSTPIGPVLVTADEIGPAPDLEISCEVDGEVVQRSRTSDLIFGPAEVASYLSQIVTLEPGDVISTGTPAGVGSGRRPPTYLQPGQVVRTTIEGIGSCVNPVGRLDETRS